MAQRENPEASGKTGRWFGIVFGSACIAIVAIVLQIIATYASERPGWGNGAILTNSILGIGVGAYGLYLSTETGKANENPQTVNGIIIALGIYALTQAIISFLIHFYG